MKQHWASVWGNAISIGENRPEGYNRNITFRYPIYSQFGGTAVRLTFDNFCGTEPVTFNKVTAFIGGKFYPVTFGGNREATVGAGEIYTLFYREVESGFLFKGEQHSMFELTYVDRGALHCVVDGNGVELHQGQLMVFGPQQWHMQYSSKLGFILSR